MRTREENSYSDHHKLSNHDLNPINAKKSKEDINFK